MLANRLDRIRWRLFVLARVDRTHRKSVRESKVSSEKVENALFCKPLMRPNKRTTHVIYAVLEPSPPLQFYFASKSLAN